jgi:hypothetical protein
MLNLSVAAKKKPLKRFLNLFVPFITGLKPGVNER